MRTQDKDPYQHIQSTMYHEGAYTYLTRVRDSFLLK